MQLACCSSWRRRAGCAACAICWRETFSNVELTALYFSVRSPPPKPTDYLELLIARRANVNATAASSVTPLLRRADEQSPSHRHPLEQERRSHPSERGGRAPVVRGSVHDVRERHAGRVHCGIVQALIESASSTRRSGYRPRRRCS